MKNSSNPAEDITRIGVEHGKRGWQAAHVTAVKNLAFVMVKQRKEVPAVQVPQSLAEVDRA